MAQLLGFQTASGFGRGQLAMPRRRRPGVASSRCRCVDHEPCWRTVGILGLGVGHHPLRNRFSVVVENIAQPYPVGASRGLANRLPAVGKLLTSLKTKLPVSGEWKTFLPMAILFSTMAFVNTIVSNLSMSLVVTAPGGGAGVLPFLTVYAAFPLTIGATILYAYASHYMSHKRLFTITVGIFAAFNLLFALCLFPNHEALHLPGVASTLAKFLPAGLNGAVGMVRNWTFSIFYCLSEMWGDMGISLLFWGFANDITTSKQAPILYPLMGIGANVAQTLGGIALKMFSVGSAAAFSTRFQTLLFQIVGCMVGVMALHHFIASHSERKESRAKERRMAEQKGKQLPPNGNLLNSLQNAAMNEKSAWGTRSLNHPHVVGVCRGRRLPLPAEQRVSSYDLFSEKGNMLEASFRPKPIYALGKLPLINIPQDRLVASPKLPEKQPEPKKEKLTFAASLKTLKESPIIQSLGMMTVAQALSVTLMEFVWKSHLKIAYPTPAAFSAFMGDIATAVGLLTGAMMFLSPILFNRIGWKGVAKMTPVLMTVGGCAFFALASAFHVLGRLGMTHIANQLLPFTVIGGAFLFVLSRGTKFSLFKPSEEMVYIKMDASQRTKGKAAVDVVGANVGKSGGSILQQVLLVLSGGHLLFITPVMFAVYMFMMRGWNRAVHTLAPFTEEAPASAEAAEKPETLKSRPVDIDLDEEGEETTPLTHNAIPWDEDRESVGSSVVEFPLHSELDDYPTDEVHSHPLAVSNPR